MTIYTVDFTYQGQSHTKILFDKAELARFFDNEGQRVNIISISEENMEMRTANSRRPIGT